MTLLDTKQLLKYNFALIMAPKLKIWAQS